MKKAIPQSKGNDKRSLNQKSGAKKSMKEITRRQSLKTMAAGAYAVPATMVLLSAQRAVAQSCPAECTLVDFTVNSTNNTSVLIRWEDCQTSQSTNWYITSTNPFENQAACGTQVRVSYPNGGSTQDYDVSADPNQNDFSWP